MDPQAGTQPSVSVGRLSALPRPSKLPLPRSSIPTPRQSSIDRPTNASKARATASATPKARPPLSATQTNARTPLHLRDASTTSSASHDGPFRKPTTRPLSRANLQAQARARQASGSSSMASQHEDDLGSLHSFRSDATHSTNATSPTDTPITPTFRKPSRPSLSERTIESLQSIPPSPGSLRRKSSFFSPDSPMVSRSRPASSLSTTRPVSKDGPFDHIHGMTPRALNAKPSLPNFSASARATPGRFVPSSGSSNTVRARSPTKSSMLRSVDKEAVAPVAAKPTARGAVRGSRTVAARVQQPRGSVADLFGGEIPKQSITPISTLKSATKPALKKAPASKEEAEPSPKASQAAKSSAALREQIRAAKAARLSSGKQAPSEAVPDFDPSQFKNPFNARISDERTPIRVRVDAARSDGRLNISAMGLKDIPEDVMNMYDFESNKDTSIQWNEVVDLTRFVAADNEIETIPDACFPDVDATSFDQDDDVASPRFGGLELLDLHGNVLFDVPRGLRRLECLTSLNLSHNRLMNDALETIAQIPSLRELKLADNMLTGELNFIEQLTSLEVLEVQDNKLSVLPDEISALVKLRYLNVSNNQLTNLPIIELSSLPLVELHASKNKLSGTLFTTAGIAMDRLQSLDVSVNQLTALYDGTAGPEFPALRVLNIAFNAICSLPDILAWSSLASLLAEDNKITQLPMGFVESSSIRSADFTGNNLNKLDERIALMDNLETFKIAANPLRERKFLTMGTDDLKQELAARLGPVGFIA